MPASSARTAALDGVRAALPVLLGVAPFGLIVGATAAATEIGGLVGFLSSPIVFAGAAQIATIQLVDQGSTALVVIATALVINSRHLMYSAGLAGAFGDFPLRWRLLLAYGLTDHLFVLASIRYERLTDPVGRRWYALGVALTLWIAWQAASAVGVLVGAAVPASWNLDFAVPLVFLGLMPGAVRDRPALAATLVAGATAVVAAPLAWNLGLVAATLAGVLTGVILDRGRP